MGVLVNDSGDGRSAPPADPVKAFEEVDSTDCRRRESLPTAQGP